MFFTRPVPAGAEGKAVIQPIKKCKPLKKRIKTFSELNLDFRTIEENVVSFDLNSAIVP